MFQSEFSTRAVSVCNSKKTLQGLEGVRNIADDIIIWGRMQKEHDTRLEALMKRLFDSDLTLNDSKCTCNVDSIWFYGYILSKDSISADKHKIEALVNMKVQEDISQLHSFWGWRPIVNVSSLTWRQ